MGENYRSKRKITVIFAHLLFISDAEDEAIQDGSNDDGQKKHRR